MKIRSGFVSNSSSSSFIVAGYVLTPKDFADIHGLISNDDVYEYIDLHELSWYELNDGRICVGDSIIHINYDEASIPDTIKSVSEIHNFVKDKLPNIDSKYEFVIVTGDELC